MNKFWVNFVKFSQRHGIFAHWAIFGFSLVILAFYTCVMIAQNRFFPFKVVFIRPACFFELKACYRFLR